MKHIIDIVTEDQLLKILIAVAVGSALGLEREYKRKAAGMRTMTLICVSSAVFTILSAQLGNPGSPDRVASNILTGVGFIGAGVIFKGDFAIDGITTAATIWIAAALGMAIGMSQYWLVGFSLAGALLVLIAMVYIEKWVAKVNDKRFYVIYFNEDKFPHHQMEDTIRSLGLKHKRLLVAKENGVCEVNYAVHGHRNKMKQLDEFLLQRADINRYQIQSNPS
ncbi:MgtC/SapB family protein [Chitinophaga vietnamensis]|uniref:MgtC/SapB family protein n=1 Tax=Chitinophaga vietnamensis TaxID=2593957 RepID=UPI001178B17C|nr:MgtC/SapB family protein [Chitinophaga vietnamensis]